MKITRFFGFAYSEDYLLYVDNLKVYLFIA
jgi:hypothetical protein